MSQLLQARSLSSASSDESIQEYGASSEAQPSLLSPLDTSNRPRSRESRHAKRLSLHFPILIPSNTVARQQQYSASSAINAVTRGLHESSTTPSPTHSHHVSAPSPSVPPMPLTPPSEWSEDNAHLGRSASLRTLSRTDSHRRAKSTALHHTTPGCAPDFLTLLASQERRVMELREELIRAEGELIALKKSWTVYESSRKKIESKVGAARLSPIQQSTSTTPISALMLEPTDEECPEELKKELLKQQFIRRGTLDGTFESGSILGRRPSQRVFSGSRHTRALSLLTAHPPVRNINKSVALDTADVKAPDSNAPTSERAPETASSSGASKVSFDFLSSARPQPTHTDGASTIIRDSASLNLGKTYKDFASAASKRSIPQGLQVVNGGAEVLVKQGKMVVDGVRDGLWNFFEDIRQATVGEEAAREIAAVKKREANSIALAKQRSKPKGSAEGGETSFWKEFGVDTPRGDKATTSIVAKTPAPLKLSKTSIPSPQGHTRNFSKPLTQSIKRDQSSGHNTPIKSPLPVSTSPDDAPIEPILEPDLDHDSESEHLEHRAPIVFPSVSTSSSTLDHSPRDHESKSSTDSGDSRCTPSLVADSSRADDYEDEVEVDIELEAEAEVEAGVDGGENHAEDLEADSWDWDSSMVESPLASRLDAKIVVLPKRQSSMPDVGDWHSLTN